MMVDADKQNTTINLLIILFLSYVLVTAIIFSNMDKKITQLDDSIYVIEINELLTIYDHEYLQNKTDSQIEIIALHSVVERRYYKRTVEDLIEYRDYNIDN